MLQRDITLEEAKVLFEAAETWAADPKRFLKDVKTDWFALKLNLDQVVCTILDYK